MAKSTSQTIKVGIFMIIGTILLTFTLYYIGKQQNIFGKNIQLYSTFENVNGLQIGNNVRYSGINVGTVTDIEMSEGGMITIKMTIEEKTASFIKKDATASISSDGLVGSMVVNIAPGNNKKAGVVVSGDTIQSHTKTGTDAMLSTLSVTNENVAILSADLLKITHEILEGKGTIGVLVKDTNMAQNIKQIMAETSQAISRVNNIISKINYDESAAAVILSDTAAANQIRRVVVNLDKSSADIKEMTKNLNDYLNEIKSGKGAINHVTLDENFVKEIDSTMLNIKEAAIKLNVNMEAMRENFLFRGYFKKAEKQEKKDAKKSN